MRHWLLWKNILQQCYSHFGLNKNQSALQGFFWFGFQGGQSVFLLWACKLILHCVQKQQAALWSQTFLLNPIYESASVLVRIFYWCVSWMLREFAHHGPRGAMDSDDSNIFWCQRFNQLVVDDNECLTGRSLLGDCWQGWTSYTSDLYILDVCNHISSPKWKSWKSLSGELSGSPRSAMCFFLFFFTQEDSKNSFVQPWNGWKKLLASTSLALQRAANWERSGSSCVAQKALNFERFLGGAISESWPVAIKKINYWD